MISYSAPFTLFSSDRERAGLVGVGPQIITQVGSNALKYAAPFEADPRCNNMTEIHTGDS